MSSWKPWDELLSQGCVLTSFQVMALPAEELYFLWVNPRGGISHSKRITGLGA